MLAVTMLCPILGGLLLGCFRSIPAKIRRAAAVGVMCVTSLMVAALIRTGVPYHTLLSYTDRFTLSIGLDHRGKVFLALMAVLWPLSTLYAVEYMAHEEREATFFMWFLLAYGVMIPFCCAANLFTLYVLYECVTMVTLPLVWHKKDLESIRAARSYVRYSIGCAAFGLTVVVILSSFGSLRFSRGGNGFQDVPEGLLNALYLTAFFGFGVKAAVFPFSRWLPKAGAAPTPVTALLHAVAVVNAGVFSVQRVTYDVFGTARLANGWGRQAALAAACLTVLYGAVMAVREHHVKRRLAYSTVSNLGYMLLGTALMTAAGDAAATLHMVCHSLIKIVLFFCIGGVMTQTGLTQVAEMRGLGRRMPFTFAAFFVASLALMGIPPLAGFASKYALIEAAVDAGGFWPLMGAASLIVSAILTAVYTMTVALPAWYLPAGAEAGKRGDPGWRMLVSIYVILALMIAAGLWPGALMGALRG